MRNKNFPNSAKTFLSLAAILCSTLPVVAENSQRTQIEIPSAESVLIDDFIKLQPKRPKVALVLGGGGLRGAAHVGILRVLEREGIPIDMVVGTSMGAVVGGLYCAGVSTERLEKDIVRCFISSYYTAPLTVQALKMNVSYLMLRKPQGLYDGGNLARSIDNYVPAQQREISNLRPKFAAVTTDLVEGRTRTLTEGDLGKAIQASTAVPLLRKPVSMGDALLVDGGAICNLPVDQAKLLGADFVIAIDVDERIESTVRKKLNRHVFKTSSRIVSLMLAKIDEGQKLAADVCIQPDVTGISLLSRKSSEGERAIFAGEDAAARAMPELKMKLMAAGVELYPVENSVSAKLMVSSR
ncbi:MAG: patatin-like phospholipase family protein [Candidatus Obscuribacterales bacterium]|nr:patatin-like phospholipase family protein [Candidatus Obscuribacterales bacterium]